MTEAIETSIDLRATREALRTQLIQLPEAMRNTPSKQWWFSAYRFVRRAERSLPTYPPDMQVYLGGIIGTARQMLKDEVHPSETQMLYSEEIEDRTDCLIYELSRVISAPYCEQLPETVQEQTVAITDIVKERPDVLKISDIREGARFSRAVHVQHPLTCQTYTFPLPTDDTIYYKGGIARLMLNLVADAPVSMVASEIPWNDLDVIALGDPTKSRIRAMEMGVDPDGIEMIGDSLDFIEYSLGRDVDHNQALVGAEYLVYTPDAYDAAQSGNISLTGLYMPNRALYGTDIFHRNGLFLGTPRGMMRLVKPVVEGKALSFTFHPANKYIDMAPYFLFLARKWSKKPQFPVFLQRLLAVGKAIGQVDEGEGNPIDMLENMHRQYPLFDLQAQVQSGRDVAIWKAGKIIRQVDRQFTWEFHVPGDLVIPDEELLVPATRIQLADFEENPALSEKIVSQWPAFSERSRERVEQARQDPALRSNRYFLKNDLRRRTY
jgi:hypothetical protein